MSSFLTPEQYLEIERKAEFKNEYYRGEMFEMPRVPIAHKSIMTNTGAELSQQLRKRPGTVYLSQMRVCVLRAGFYTYPDIVVVGGQLEVLDAENDTLVNPTVVIEVVSKSTEAYDRGTKFHRYQSLESLAEYLLISSMEVSADLYTRQADGSWRNTTKFGLDDSIELQSIGCHLLLADVYEKVEFKNTPEGA